MKKTLSLLLGALFFAAAVTAQTPAKSLATTGAPVNVSQAAPPAGSGRACVTTNSTHCTWQLLSGIGLLTLPVSTANGGTGADMSNALTFAKSANGDTATSAMFLSATDSGANTSNVSVGIELPNSAGTAGDLVVRTGGTGASGSGTERGRVTGTGSWNLTTTNVNISSPVGSPSPVQVFITGMNGNGDPIYAAINTTTDSSDWFSVNNVNGAAAAYFAPTSVLFADASPLVTPTGALLQASSLTGISLLAQTSATGGGNPNPTAVFAGNTGQTAPLTEWRGTDGTTVVTSVSPKGIVTLTPDADGSTAVTLTATDVGGGVDLFSWDLTTGAEHAIGTIGSTGYDSNFHSFAVPAGWSHFSAGPLGAPIFAVSDSGNIDAASFSVASTPGASCSGSVCTITAVVNGIITACSCTP